ncbi:MAG: hypothetical protein NZ560_01785 [Aquificaceae bacterium]|nr:hypothetical protein [Aquificaceae bacterium]MDW8096963.1 hypothetical protein [Aquificaceae bacterium]
MTKVKNRQATLYAVRAHLKRRLEAILWGSLLALLARLILWRFGGRPLLSFTFRVYLGLLLKRVGGTYELFLHLLALALAFLLCRKSYNRRTYALARRHLEPQ